ncbi:Fe-S cluster assembly protein SufD [Gluconobacter frateurii]|uniref:Iron-sulfur assembly protein SufD n=1 Tax=Gluconobacter frateurii NRIC 0228 TaxID=1307946 RepID=A0ABQ0QDN4_9PROT|nr:Fe-S cluster assembly protein SufD [Gluconobacter frateurii]GBR14687.1 iron-sulfur assembly protein SufD [Gluconobacter frateurii NRIC 0228]GLP90113.1 Fe-S cluster assembly protein SufD [Gluconobacter frateurii]
MSIATTVQASLGLEAFVARSAGHGTALSAMGIPTRRVEEWRYTPLRAFADTVWAESPALSDAHAQTLLAGLPLPEAGSHVVFANGRKVEALSSLSDSISQSAVETAEPFEDRFSAVLNAALMQDGLSVRVPAGTDAGLLTLVSLTAGENISTHLRHQIVLEEGASLTLFDVNAGEGRYVTNPRFDIVVGKSARLTHVKLQQESLTAGHLAIVAASVDANGNYDSFTLNNGSELARHEVVATLTAAHAQVHVNGIQIVDGSRLNDLTSMIHHAAPDCGSRQTVKTVLSENGQGVFQGKILVDRIAQKTDGYQMNQALLLSEKAQINSKPELEIYADDVKCSHGATVGALDDEQLFYLRSRGIPEAEARDILVRAFLLDALDLVTDETLRALLQGSIRA